MTKRRHEYGAADQPRLFGNGVAGEAREVRFALVDGDYHGYSLTGQRSRLPAEQHASRIRREDDAVGGIGYDYRRTRLL